MDSHQGNLEIQKKIVFNLELYFGDRALNCLRNSDSNFDALAQGTF